MLETEAVEDAMGNLRIGYKNLTAEDMESLKALKDSPHWKVYRKLLESALAEYTRASWQVTGVDGVVKMLHSAGLAAGINFSINQLSVLVGQTNLKQQKALEKPDKKPQSFVRG